jgi:uncharacterized protein with von Willebrand factor type A (vWA) domain
VQLGDSRTGKLADNVTGFGRRCAVPACGWTARALRWPSRRRCWWAWSSKPDLSAAMEAVLVSREQDRMVFRELFDIYFRNPEVANKLLSQMLPSAEGKAEPSKRRPRVREALQPQKAYGSQANAQAGRQEVDFDAAMTASDLQRLKHADFSALSGSEYHLVERLARDMACRCPVWRRAVCARARVAPRALERRDAPCGAHRRRDHATAPAAAPRAAAAPAGAGGRVGLDGALCAAAAGFPACSHAACTAPAPRDVFAFGTHLTDLTPAFRLGDTDAMLAAASAD